MPSPSATRSNPRSAPLSSSCRDCPSVQSALRGVDLSGLSTQDSGLDSPIPNMNHPRRFPRNIVFMRDHDDRVAAVVEVAEEVEDLAAGLGVEVAGGLVGQ